MEISYHFPSPPVWRMDDVDWRKRLRAAVARSGKKQSAIARDAGVAPETLSRVLTATLAHPSFDSIVRIARAVNENVGWLLGERAFSLSADEQKQLRNAARIIEDALLGMTLTRRERPEPNALPVAAADIPRAYGVRGARLAYEATGDSMIGAGITDRDVLYVKPTRSMREANRHVVVCRFDGADYVKVLDVRGNGIRLLSRSDQHPAIEVVENDRFELIGIVVGRSGALS